MTLKSTFSGIIKDRVKTFVAMKRFRVFIPPTYPLLRKLPDNVLQQNKGKSQERGRHGILGTVDATQEGSEDKSQAESRRAGLKNSHSRSEQEDAELQDECLWGNMNSRQQVA